MQHIERPQDGTTSSSMSGLAQRATLRSLQVCDPTSGDVLADEVWRPLLTGLVGEQHGSGGDVVAPAVGPLTGYQIGRASCRERV